MVKRSLGNQKSFGRRTKRIVISDESSSSSIQEKQKAKEPFDDVKHCTKVNVRKHATYKQGNFKNKNMKSFAKNMDVFSLKYTEISNRFSIRPKKKLCVFTGLPAMFTCPYTLLPYYDSSVYKYIKTLNSDTLNFIYETKNMCADFNPFNSTK